jgi:pimeloyl-ACP methyl ester carboxylesterase
MEPQAPEREAANWYQYYFHSERGRAGLAQNRHALGKLLWRMWSPTWKFDEATYARTAASFDNPDFVDVVIHSYRVRYGLVAGDPAMDQTERRLAPQPPITVPTIVLHGHDNGISPLKSSERHASQFKGPYERRVIDGVGHNLPQEAPAEFAAAVLALA